MTFSEGEMRIYKIYGITSGTHLYGYFRHKIDYKPFYGQTEKEYMNLIINRIN